MVTREQTCTLAGDRTDWMPAGQEPYSGTVVSAESRGTVAVRRLSIFFLGGRMSRLSRSRHRPTTGTRGSTRSSSACRS